MDSNTMTIDQLKAALQQGVTELQGLVGELRKRNTSAGAVRKSADPWDNLIDERDIGVVDFFEPHGVLIRQVIAKAVRIRKASAMDPTKSTPTPSEIAALSAMQQRRSPDAIRAILGYPNTDDGRRDALEHMLELQPAETAAYLVALLTAGDSPEAQDRALDMVARTAEAGFVIGGHDAPDGSALASAIPGAVPKK